MKYSFIMPYYNRAEQLHNTLVSFVRFYRNRKDFEVILIVDSKQIPMMLCDLNRTVDIFSEELVIKLYKGDSRRIYNPVTAFNIGVTYSSGEYLILTNPECEHEGDILCELDSIYNKNSPYVVCGCKSLKKDRSFDRWYQHSKHRPENYHFCSVITKEDYNKIGGFNEDYAEGYGYDDNSFRDRVWNSGIPFVVRDDLVVLHQFHEKVKSSDWRSRLDRNKKLYEKEFANG